MLNASLMIEAGVNLKRLQILMGHASFKVTMDTYAHLVPELRDDAVRGVAEMVLGAPDPDASETIGSKMVAGPVSAPEKDANSTPNLLISVGSPGRIRTADQRINSPSLYH